MNWERIAYKVVLFVALGIMVVTFGRHMLPDDTVLRYLFILSGGVISGVLVSRWAD